MKKLKSLLSLAFISLMTASCSGGNDITGTYSFKMGKAGQTASFGASMVLTNVDYTDASKEVKDKNPKLMNLNISLGDEEMKGIEELLNIFKTGYYYTHTDSNKLSLCFPKLLKALEDFGIEITKYVTEADLTKIIEHLVYSYIDGQKIKLTIPVFGKEDFTNPENDIVMNLCWYGLYVSPTNPVSIVTKLDFDNAPNAGQYKHEPGSKIPDAAVYAMNKDFVSYFCNTGVEVQIEGTWTTVAGIYPVEVEEGEIVYHVAMYPKYKGSMILANANAKIVNRNILLIENEKPACLELKVDEQYGDYVVDKVFEDNTKQKETSMSNYKVKDKFTYRKAHNVEIGLTKE